jgi:hypothetical protein
LCANDGSESTYLSGRNEVVGHWLPIVRIQPTLWRTTHNEQLTNRLLLNGCLKTRNQKSDGQIFDSTPHDTPT